MYFLCLCWTVQSSLWFVFACRSGRTPSRRMQVSPSSSWWTRAGGWRRFQFHSQSLGYQPLSSFTSAPSLHGPPLLKSLQPCWWGGSLWFWAGGKEKKKKEKKKSMMAGGRLKWSLGEWGWTIFEFKSPFNICSSQWGLGRGGRLGRRWEAFWSLGSWWHMGNGSWFPPVLLSVFVSLLYLPVLIFAVRCRPVVFFFSLHPHI